MQDPVVKNDCKVSFRTSNNDFLKEGSLSTVYVLVSFSITLTKESLKERFSLAYNFKAFSHWSCGRRPTGGSCSPLGCQEAEGKEKSQRERGAIYKMLYQGHSQGLASFVRPHIHRIHPWMEVDPT